MAVVEPSSTHLVAWRPGLLDSAELGLGDAVNAVQRDFIYADVFADHVGRDSRVAKSQCQRVGQRKLAKCALIGGEFVGHLISVRALRDDEVSSPLLDFRGIRVEFAHQRA
jgi:hypothetical protein